MEQLKLRRLAPSVITLITYTLNIFTIQPLYYSCRYDCPATHYRHGRVSPFCPYDIHTTSHDTPTMPIYLPFHKINRFIIIVTLIIATTLVDSNTSDTISETFDLITRSLYSRATVTIDYVFTSIYRPLSEYSNIKKHSFTVAGSMRPML